MGKDRTQYLLTPEKHEQIFREEIVPIYEGRDIRPRPFPIAIMLGGQPGAGKSHLQSIAEREFDKKGRILSIIGDKLRDFHPDYLKLQKINDETAAFYTDLDSGKWIKKSIEYAKKKKWNLLIEGTMRRFEVVENTMISLKKSGYKIDARVVAVHPSLSMLGIYQRYEGMKAAKGFARFTTPEAHEAGVKGMPITIAKVESQKLADRISVYERGNDHPIYQNTLEYDVKRKRVDWVLNPSIKSVIQRKHQYLSLAEKIFLKSGWDQILQKMRDRSATEIEVHKVNSVIQQEMSKLNRGMEM